MFLNITLTAKVYITDTLQTFLQRVSLFKEIPKNKKSYKSSQIRSRGLKYFFAIKSTLMILIFLF